MTSAIGKGRKEGRRERERERGQVVEEVPIRVGSPEGGSHEHYTPRVSLSSLCFSNFPDLSLKKIFPWEHRNIVGSSPPHNSVGGFFCRGGGDPSKYKEK
jgi:hypothetical protein